MSLLGGTIIAALGLWIMGYLSRWAAKPTVHQLMRYPGNEVAAERWRLRWDQHMLERALAGNSADRV